MCIWFAHARPTSAQRQAPLEWLEEQGRWRGWIYCEAGMFAAAWVASPKMMKSLYQITWNMI
ncbi:hypothetical protein GCM10010916_47350 [Paenibacillus abyssi]|uniref:Uncharacterized protein n=1 Tax=Paenibacillus abyssi TaxID=1340531 RepID=A0A917LI20_9BACL|nr:hypothetical protein GCM10010916_47350 [Paenibacillus abyssi]